MIATVVPPKVTATQEFRCKRCNRLFLRFHLDGEAFFESYCKRCEIMSHLHVEDRKE